MLRPKDIGEKLRVFQRTILENPYIPHRPSQKQSEFLLCEDPEVLYGGAAAGGKTDALLMAALQFQHEPEYKCLILRRNYADLALPDAIMDRAHRWLRGTPAQWNDRNKTYTFPSGARVTFGYLQAENHKYRYQGTQFHRVIFDELTQFTDSQYNYLFSRLRKTQGDDIPTGMRTGSNPGGVGHAWVRAKFIDAQTRSGRFISARISDNPFIDQTDYLKRLEKLDIITRRQLRDGDWDVKQQGELFHRGWFAIVSQDEELPKMVKTVRYWDLAATQPAAGKDPDYTVGLKLGFGQDGKFYVLSVVRARKSPGDVERLISQTAEIDGYNVQQIIEQEPGASGKMVVDHYARNVLRMFTVHGFRRTGSKTEMARPVSAIAEPRQGGDSCGKIMLVRGSWNMDFLDELEVFPNEASHDDQVDALTGAYAFVYKLAPPVLDRNDMGF